MSNFNLNTYMSLNRKADGLVKKIECVDGFTISVQASDIHYADFNIDGLDYSHVECGFPNSEPEYIMDYADDPSSPTDTVYGYVPIELVESLINLHNDRSNIKLLTSLSIPV